jgi:imidazoleglycerol phosphate dehydratase HisB
MHPTIAAALRPYMPHSENERAAYMVGDRTTQMLLARLEALEDAVGVMLHAIDMYGADSDEYAEALAAVREMLP